MQPELPVEAVEQRDHLDVDVGIVDPQHLGAELLVLAVATLLRALGTGSWARRTSTSTAPAGGAARTPARPMRSPPAAARAGARPGRRTRTSPCSRRRWSSRRGGTPRRSRRSGSHQSVAETAGPVGEAGDQLLPAIRLGRQDVPGADRRAEDVSRFSGLGHDLMLPAPFARSRAFAVPAAASGRPGRDIGTRRQLARPPADKAEEYRPTSAKGRPLRYRRDPRGVHRPARERGAVLVEFVIVMPLLLGLVLGMITFGNWYNSKLNISTAAQGRREVRRHPAPCRIRKYQRVARRRRRRPP